MALVIYDGDCAFCSTAARFAQRKVAPTLSYSPYQRTDLTKYGISTVEAQSSLKFVKTNGEVVSAQKAVSQIMKCGNSFWKAFGVITELPGINLLAALGYKLTAKYRHKLPGGTPTCKM